jgi:hypothetical protein
MFRFLDEPAELAHQIFETRFLVAQACGSGSPGLSAGHFGVAKHLRLKRPEASRHIPRRGTPIDLDHRFHSAQRREQGAVLVDDAPRGGHRRGRGAAVGETHVQFSCIGYASRRTAHTDIVERATIAKPTFQQSMTPGRSLRRHFGRRASSSLLSLVISKGWLVARALQSTR